MTRNLLLKSTRIDYDRIHAIFFDTEFENAKMKCLDVLFTAPKWSCLIYMLENILYGENAIRKKAFEAINLWLSVFNRSFTEPSKAQTDEIKRLINVLEDVLPPGVKKEILFTMPN